MNPRFLFAFGCLLIGMSVPAWAGRSYAAGYLSGSLVIAGAAIFFGGSSGGGETHG